MSQRAVALAKPRVYRVHQGPVTPTASGPSRAARGRPGCVQPETWLTGEFQLNSISPLASVTAARAGATQRAKFHIERENPLIP